MGKETIVRPYEMGVETYPKTNKNDSKMDRTRNRPLDMIRHTANKSKTKQSIRTKEIATHYNNEMDLLSKNNSFNKNRRSKD